MICNKLSSRGFASTENKIMFKTFEKMFEGAPRLEARIEKIRNKEDAFMQKVFPYSRNSEEYLNKVEFQKAEQIKADMKVTINRRNINDLLEIGRLSSEEEDERAKKNIMRGNYFKARIKREEELGIRPLLTKDDPHLIYGALASSADDFKIGGSQGLYGDIILILKNGKVMNRTTFSAGESHMGVVTQKNAHFLKYITEKGKTEGAFPSYPQYIEAQIAGGVSIDDIQEIRISDYSSSEERGIILNDSKMHELLKKYPQIKLTIVTPE